MLRKVVTFLSHVLILVEEVFLRIINEPIAIKARVWLQQLWNGVAVAVDAEYFPVLILNRLVVSIVLAPQVEHDVGTLEGSLVGGAV